MNRLFSNSNIIDHKLVYQVLRWRVHWIDITYTAKRLGIALPNHYLVALFNEFHTILEFECDLSLVVCLNEFLVEYLHGLHCLPDSSNMQHGLVARFDMRVVVQHLDLSVEVLHAESLVRVHTFGFCSDWIY